MIRTTPVEVGTKPYNWETQYKYQCTWYAYYRCGEKGLPYPCWWDRATQTGSYTDAKYWLENYRDPWIPKDTDYIPVENDVVVFDGNYGHVAFIEKVEGDTALLSQYKNGDENSFSNYSWKIGTSYTGPLKGYLHLPVSSVDPVPRDNTVDQIETTDPTLRIRVKPSLDAEIVGHVQLGYYNVLNQKKADGYTWYEIEKNRWCADISTNYLPASGEDDIIRLIKEYTEKVQNTIKSLNAENKDLKDTLKKIHELSEV